MNELQNYKNYLSNILGYSDKTIITYLFYVKKLLNSKKDYKIVMNNHPNNTNNTKRVMLSAFKNYYKYEKNHIREEIILPKKEKRIKDHITFYEYERLLLLENKFSKRLIIKMLFETGVRSSELLAIKIKDINEQKILINGKNKKQRIIYVSQVLSNLIEEFTKYKNLNKDNYLFDFDYRNLYKHIKNAGTKINKDLTPHMFRRGFATYCMDKGIGIYEISLMLGHENIDTTKTYLRNDNKIEIMKHIFS